MRLGMSGYSDLGNAETWAEKLEKMQVHAVAFPLDYHADIHRIDAYVEAAKAKDIVIAEVGAWCNPMDPDPEKAKAAEERCVEQLKLADYIGANCSTNTSGSAGPVRSNWYPENFDEAFYDRVVSVTRRIIEKAAPKRTCYTLEPMPWMVPTGPDEYLKLIEDVDSAYMKAHLDIVNWINSFERFSHQRAFIDDVFSKMHGKIVSCHFKDLFLNQKLTFQLEECPVGKGMFDIDYYVKKVNEENPDMPLLIEHLPNDAAYDESMAYVVERYRER